MGGGITPKIEVDNPGIIEAGRMGDTNYSQSAVVIDPDGISPSMLARDGKEPKKIDVTDIEPDMMVSQIETTVRVRKYEIDRQKLVMFLRKHLNAVHLSRKDLAEKLDRPITEVDHWFRTDEYGSIPDPDIWFKMKDVLSIEDDTYDEAITVFEERPNGYDMSNRCYDPEGISPTLKTQNGIKITVETDDDPSIMVDGVLGKSTQHYKVYDPEDVAPTIAACDEKDPCKVITHKGEDTE